MSNELEAILELVQALNNGLPADYHPQVREPTEISLAAAPQPPTGFELDRLVRSDYEPRALGGTSRNEDAPAVHTSRKSGNLKGTKEIGGELIYLKPSLRDHGSPANNVIAQANVLAGTSFHDWSEQEIGAVGMRAIYWVTDDLALTGQVSYSKGDIAQQETVLNPLAGRLGVAIRPEYTLVLRGEAGAIWLPLGNGRFKAGIGAGIDHSLVKAELELDVQGIDYPPASSNITSKLQGNDWGYWAAGMARVQLGENSALWIQAGHNKDVVDTAGKTTSTNALGSVTAPEKLETGLDGFRGVVGVHYTW